MSTVFPVAKASIYFTAVLGGIGVGWMAAADVGRTVAMLPPAALIVGAYSLCARWLRKRLAPR